MLSENAARELVVDVVRRLEGMGFNHGNSGNVSVRFKNGFLITPTGANAGNLIPDRLVKLNGKEEVIGKGIPSSEWQMHAEILKAFPDAHAVVHTHADACVALSCLRKPLPAFHYMVAAFGGNDVRCADYETYGTAELARSAVNALKGRTACLLANHGMIAIGKNLETASNTTVKLETLARQYLLCLQGGQPVLLPDQEMQIVLERYNSYGIASIDPVGER